MGLERISCSLENIISFIVRKNGVKKLQFILYGSPKKRRQAAESGDSWTRDGRKTYFLSLNDKRIGLSFQDTAKNLRMQKNKLMGLTSLIILPDIRMRHIPMIDFCNSCSEKGLSEAMMVLHQTGQEEGFLLESGCSYHYYGINLLNAGEWAEFMKMCQTWPAIGRDWPQLQLEDGFSTLRVSTSLAKPQLPRVIAKFGKFNFSP